MVAAAEMPVEKQPLAIGAQTLLAVGLEQPVWLLVLPLHVGRRLLGLMPIGATGMYRLSVRPRHKTLKPCAVFRHLETTLERL
jgi:hypothetical protein